MDDTTDDRVLDGQVRLRQPARGYRAGADAALLAAACDAGPGARVIEAGCGAGGALLAAAARRTGARFVGVERDPKALALARENIGLNDMADRVEVMEGDVGLRFAGLGLEPFDAAMANPPFFDDPDALRGPAAERRGAWIADDGLEAWIGFLTKAVREGGTITLIHRADRLDDILGLLASKAGSVQIRPVLPFADEPAKRVVVRAVKTGKAPLRLLPALVLHDRPNAAGDGGQHTQAAEAILRGRAALEWL
ncbi:tRNA1(Val) (adenine(37)-N6)-methyltransferase [Phenylobacterium sp.]|jgi:tRNA1(Val) A37 N6-methylase TrmN6|uniref:tRNA1(Val) (adenine(37)-N6)-methyltransferase n=1 Tax=Phenylobacterium sp. TaxID=1871053 RepID=UPI002E3656D0|nr:methyltransferase [Phenylobacterium sp.]HEX3365732.1 methyltransferase [Phenylobacterium sp.]